MNAAQLSSLARIGRFGEAAQAAPVKSVYDTLRRACRLEERRFKIGTRRLMGSFTAGFGAGALYLARQGKHTQAAVFWRLLYRR